MATLGSLPPNVMAFKKMPKMRKFWKKKAKISNFRMLDLRQLYRLLAFIKLSCRLMVVFCNPFSSFFLNRLVFDIWLEGKKMMLNEETQFNPNDFVAQASDGEEVRIVFVRLFH